MDVFKRHVRAIIKLSEGVEKSESATSARNFSRLSEALDAHLASLEGSTPGLSKPRAQLLAASERFLSGIKSGNAQMCATQRVEMKRCFVAIAKQLQGDGGSSFTSAVSSSASGNKWNRLQTRSKAKAAEAPRDDAEELRRLRLRSTWMDRQCQSIWEEQQSERAVSFVVTVMRAVDLMAADPGGTSDPYVKFLGNVTSTKDKTLEPVWDESFYVKLRRGATFRMTIWDQDVGKDDALGYVDVAVGSDEEPHWLSVIGGTGKLLLQVKRQRVTNKSASSCECCLGADVTDHFECVTCKESRCVVCLDPWVCHQCHGQLCPRARWIGTKSAPAHQHNTGLLHIAEGANAPLETDWHTTEHKWSLEWSGTHAPSGWGAEDAGQGLLGNEEVDPESYTAYYSTSMMAVPHQLWVADEVLVAVERLKPKGGELCAMVVTPENTQRLMWDHLKICAQSELSVRRVIDIATHEKVQRAMLEFERLHADVNRRVGVIRVCAGQTENEIFANGGSPSFDRFVSDFLGDRVRLRGYTGYAGGLNTVNDTTGKFSVATQFLEHHIMFHVGPMLPNTEGEQCLSRKRYIGNDLVVIVYCEDGLDTFDPSVITSQMCSVFIVVDSEGRARVLGKPGVPSFAPQTPAKITRAWLLTKALNGNRAVFASKQFSMKTKRTRKELLSRLFKDVGDLLEQKPHPMATLTKELWGSSGVKAVVEQDFIASKPDELSLRKGDDILMVSLPGDPAPMALGKHEERVGAFPSQGYVTVLEGSKVQRKISSMKSRMGLRTPRGGRASSDDTSGVGMTPVVLKEGVSTWVIYFIEGKNLSVCDTFSSDPYIKVPDLNFKSKVIKSNLNPKWNASTSFVRPNPFKLRVEIWDKDVVGSDDPMGHVIVNSADFNLDQPGVEKRQWLKVRQGDGMVCVGLKRDS